MDFMTPLAASFSGSEDEMPDGRAGSTSTINQWRRRTSASEVAFSGYLTLLLARARRSGLTGLIVTNTPLARPSRAWAPSTKASMSSK